MTYEQFRLCTVVSISGKLWMMNRKGFWSDFAYYTTPSWDLPGQSDLNQDKHELVQQINSSDMKPVPNVHLAIY